MAELSYIIFSFYFLILRRALVGFGFINLFTTKRERQRK